MIGKFESAAGWTVIASDQVSGALREMEGLKGRALCLSYHFNGVLGDGGLQRNLPIAYPADHRFSLQLRGDAPANAVRASWVPAAITSGG